MEEEKKEESIDVEYFPSDKQSAVVSRMYKRFDKMRNERDQERKEFDNRTLTEYVNDNVDAYNGIIPKEIKDTKEPWQSLIFDQKTRGKVKAIVAMITSGRPFINLIGETMTDHQSSEDIRLVFEDSHRREEGQYKLYLQVLDCAIKGTVIVEEGYREIKKEQSTIIGFNHETGLAKIKKETVIEGGAGHCYTDIVPILNFYPNENCAELKHDCIVVDAIAQEDFDKRYGKFEYAKYVKTGIAYGDFANSDYKSTQKEDSELIEVLKYYNEDVDEFIIVCNGVWLNPQDKDEVCPLPFNHKRLPFAKTVFEPADIDLFYGKGMPDIMAGEQETINALLRMTVDQEVLSIHKPILLGQGAELDSYQLFPGKTFRTTGDIEQIREMDISGTQNSTFQVLEWLDKKSDVNTSVSSNTMGVAGGRKTKGEAVLLDENAKRMSGNFQTFIYHLIYQRATLRVPNICQFYKDPVSYEILKDKYGKNMTTLKGKEINKPKYREIAVDKIGKEPFWVKLSPEKCGARLIVRLEADVEPSMTRQEQLDVASALLEESKVNSLIDVDAATINFILKTGSNPEQFYIKPSPDDMKASKDGKVGEVEAKQPNAGIPA